MIDKLRVRNFRCLRDVEVPLGPLNFLIGPNNTGKSSLLDAVELLSLCVHTDGVGKVFHQTGKLFGRIVTGCDTTSDITYHLHVGGLCQSIHVEQAEYTLSIGRGPEHPVIKGERLTTEAPSRGRKDSFKEPWDRDSTILWQVTRRKEYEQFACVSEALLSSPKYSLIPARMSQPCQVEPSSMLMADGYGLASCLDFLREDNPQRFQEIEDALKRFVDSVEMVRFPAAAPGKKTILFHEKGTGYKVYASEASQGLLLFLAYLTIAYSPGDARILLIEEPEVGVHPHRLRAIVELLRAISRGALGTRPVQVIATSHSPYLLDWCTKDELVFFGRDDDGDVWTRPLSDVEDIDERIEDFESLGALIYAFGERICRSHS